MQCAGPRRTTQTFPPCGLHPQKWCKLGWIRSPPIMLTQKQSHLPLVGRWPRRAAEKGDSNLWKKEIHHPHKDLFIPANFSSSDHRFAVWAIKSGTHLMAAKWGKSHQHRCKVVFLEHGVPVEHTFFLMWTHSAVPCDSKGEDPCPAVNACLVPPGLIQDPPASWADESAICSMCKPHSWAEFEASKSLFAPCSTQVQQRLLTQC